MTIEQQAEELTKAYLVSYNLAMGQVRNPEFAAQIAGTVVVAISGTMPKQQPEVNPVMGLLTQMIMTAGQGEPEPEETGNKKKK